MADTPCGRWIRLCRVKVALTTCSKDVYTYTMKTEAFEPASAEALFDLPCACQNLRRATRIVTRIYDQQLKKAGLEITQFGLLTALATTGEVNQKRLSEGFVMDSTTLTRTLDRMRKQGWISVKQGRDKREHLFSLTAAGKRQLEKANHIGISPNRDCGTNSAKEGGKR